MLNQMGACRRGEVRSDRQRSRQSWVGAVERDRITRGGGGAPAALFNQQNSRGNIPFIATGQGDDRIRLTGCDEGERVRDGTNRATMEMGLQTVKPADPQFPRIDERNGTFRGRESWLIGV